MRWTTAWLLALAVHLAVVGAVWLCCRTARAPQPLRDAVELAVLEVPGPPEKARDKPEPVPEQAPVQTQNQGRERVRLHDQRRDHVHVHGHDHERDHVNEHVNVAAPVDVAGPVAASAPAPAAAPAAAPAPINLNLTPHSLSVLSTPPGPSSPSSSSTLDTSTLHGTIAGDGSIHIRNKSPVTIGSDLTQPGGVLKDWLKDPKAHAAARDGTVAIVQGTFDATDSIMRAAGQDPYRAQRMKMLDETREQRLTLAARDRTARREAELASLPRELRNIWKDAARSAKERRQIIFQLWDECQEPAEGEAEGATAGALARRQIVLFIRERLAEGSPDGYPNQELATLNLARQSRQRFDPYGRSPL